MLASKPITNAFAQAEAAFSQAVDKNQIPPITPEILASEQAQQTIDLNIKAAVLRPEKADLKTVNLMLQHAEGGNGQFTEAQLQALRGVKAILLAAQKAQEAHEASGNKSVLQAINAEVIVDPQSKGVRGSAMQYATNIFRAMGIGKTTEASTQMELLGLLAQSFINKLEATNKAFESGKNEDRRFEAKSLLNDGSTFTSYAPGVTPHQCEVCRACPERSPRRPTPDC